MTVLLKSQISNNFGQKHKSVKAYVFFKNQVSDYVSFRIYGEHVSPVISVTHMRCDSDPANIPKKSKDPTTSWVRQRKMGRDTSHVIQGSTRSGDDITESTVLTVATKANIPHLQGDLMNSCHLLVWLASAMRSIQLQTPSICHICADTGQKNKHKE